MSMKRRGGLRLATMVRVAASSALAGGASPGSGGTRISSRSGSWAGAGGAAAGGGGGAARLAGEGDRPLSSRSSCSRAPAWPGVRASTRSKPARASSVWPASAASTASWKICSILRSCSFFSRRASSMRREASWWSMSMRKMRDQESMAL